VPDYRRWQVRGGTYFLTINLLERRSDLLVRRIDDLREAVRRTRRDRPFRIDAWGWTAGTDAPHHHLAKPDH
jgi:putative transposase